MNDNFFQFHSSLRLSSAILVMTTLFFSVFCLTPGTASATHGGHIEESTLGMHLVDQTNQECCHGIFHDKNHESVKITISNQQTIKQIAVAHTPSFPNFVVTDVSGINNIDYLRNFIEGSSPPNSILRC